MSGAGAASGAGADSEDSITPAFLDAFNKEKAAIEATIDGVRACTTKLDALTREAATAFSPDELERISKALQGQVKKASEEAKKGEGGGRAQTGETKHVRARRARPARPPARLPPLNPPSCSRRHSRPPVQASRCSTR